MLSRSTAGLVFVAGSVMSVSAWAQTTAQWQGATNGNWTDASRWSSSPFAPNNGNPAGATYNAVIQATGSAYQVTSTGNVALSGLTLASSNATLAQNSGVFTLGGIANLNAGRWNLGSSAEISGGTLKFAGGSLAGSGLLRGVTVDGTWAMTAFSTLRVSNGLTLNAGSTINVVSAGTRLTFAGTQTLSGGTLNLGPNGNINVAGPGILTLASNTSVIGSGVFGTQGTASPTGSILNNGTIRSLGGTMNVHGVQITNNGIAEAAAGSTLALNGQLVNNGTIRTTGGTIRLNGNWTNAGSIQVTNGTAELGGIFNEASYRSIQATNSEVSITGTLDNTGQTLNVGATDFDLVLGGTGTLRGGTVNLAVGKTLKTSFQSTLDNVTLGGDSIVSRADSSTSPQLLLNIKGGKLGTTGSVTFDRSTDLQFEAAGGSLDGGDFLFAGTLNRVMGGGAISVTTSAQLGFTNDAPSNARLEIRGDGTFTNNGLIDAHGAGRIAVVTANTSVVNNGTLRVRDGAKLNMGERGGSFLTSWTNTGVIDVQDGTLLLSGATTTAGLGTITRGAQSVVEFTTILDNTASTLDLNQLGVVRARQGRIVGGSVTGASNFDFTSGGTGSLELYDNVQLSGDMNLGTGSMFVRGGLQLSGSVTASQGGFVLLSGSQTLSGGTYAGELKFATINSGSENVDIVLNGTTVRGPGIASGVGSNVRLTNNGSLVADQAGQFLRMINTDHNGTATVSTGGSLLLSGDWTSNGSFNIDSGTLLLASDFGRTFRLGSGTEFNRTGGRIVFGGTLDNTAKTLQIDSSMGNVELGYAPFSLRSVIRGGQIVLSGTGALTATYSASFENVHVTGDVAVGSSAGLGLLGDCRIDGRISLTNYQSFVAIDSLAGAPAVLRGAEIVLSGYGSSSNVYTATNQQTILESDVLIHGGGDSANQARIGRGFGTGSLATVTNRGTIRADVNGKWISVDVGKFENEGTFEAINGGILQLTDPINNLGWVNNGVIRADSGGRVYLYGTTKTSDLGIIRSEGGEVGMFARLDNSGSTLVMSEDLNFSLANNGRIKGGVIDSSQMALRSGVIFGGTSSIENLSLNGEAHIFAGGRLRMYDVSGDYAVRLVGAGSNLDIGSSEFSETVIFEGDGAARRMSAIGSVSGQLGNLTLTQSALVRGGNGEVYTSTFLGSITNEGRISADVNGQSITIYTERFLNTGTIEALNGGSIVYINPAGRSTVLDNVFYNGGLLRLAGQGVLSTAGVYYQDSSGQLMIELDATQSASQASVSASGGTIVAGILEVKLAETFAVRAGQSFTLFAGGLTGRFDSLLLPELSGGLYWDFASLYTAGQITVVPAPGGMVLAIVGIAGLRRRERSVR